MVENDKEQISPDEVKNAAEIFIVGLQEFRQHSKMNL